MDHRTCAVCSAPINLSRADAKTCSPRCRKRLSRRSPFPADMIGADRWVRRDASKRPLRADTGALASSTDADTWTSYRAAQASPVGVGLGWVLGAGIGCIDLDDCLDGDRLAPWAAAVLAEHAAGAVLVEISQSKRGLHIFVPMPEGRGRIHREDGHRVEIYPPESGRYIAVTGSPFNSK